MACNCANSFIGHCSALDHCSYTVTASIDEHCKRLGPFSQLLRRSVRLLVFVDGELYVHFDL